MLLAFIPKDDPIVLLVDETLERRKGKKISAKGYYRDAVRSSKSQVVKASGLEWLVMALSVKLPLVPRALALPFLTVLEYSKKCDKKRKRRHKTMLDWAGQMIRQVRRWVGKGREIILIGDGAFATRELALSCIRYGITLTSRLKMNASLFDFPPEVKPNKRGRPAQRGNRLLNFKEMLTLDNLPWKEAEIVGAGGVKRLVRYVSNTCLWGAGGGFPIPIRWVLIVDPTGKLDPMPLMSTDSLMTPEQIIEYYIERWSIEVTFEESREHLGVETQRQWSDKAIGRTTPILMGLYSLVCMMGYRLNKEGLLKMEKAAWYKKNHLTFSDMMKAVRMVIWKDNLFFRKAENSPSGENITPEIREWGEALLERILQAA